MIKLPMLHSSLSNKTFFLMLPNQYFTTQANIPKTQDDPWISQHFLLLLIYGTNKLVLGWTKLS